MLDKKKILLMLGVLVSAFLICGMLELSAAQKKHIIIIDPAHGGQETGVKLTDKITEKDITLAVAQSVQKELAKENNWEVILTRDADKTVSLEERKKNIVKIKPDVVLSLHVNSGFDKSATGFELYCPEFNDDMIKEKRTAKSGPRQEKNKYINDSVKLAKIIQENLNILFPRKGRGLRRADSPLTDGVFVPSVVVEMSFATNPEDKKRLLSANTQTEIAKALAKSIKKFY